MQSQKSPSTPQDSSCGSNEEMQVISKVNSLETPESIYFFSKSLRSKRKKMTSKIACPLFNVYTLFPNQN